MNLSKSKEQKEKESKNNYINLSCIKNKYGQINWNSAIGKTFEFNYFNIQGNVEVINVRVNDSTNKRTIIEIKIGDKSRKVFSRRNNGGKQCLIQ